MNIISLARNEENTAILARANEGRGWCMYGGQTYTWAKLPLSHFQWKLKFLHEKKAAEAVKKAIKGYLTQKMGFSKTEADRLLEHEMNQWLGSRRDAKRFFEAFNLELPEELSKFIDAIETPFPDELQFTA